MDNYQFTPVQVGVPIIGETLEFLSDPNFIEKRYQQYGFIFKTRLIARPTVVMVGPEAAEVILSSHMNCFS
ncbi:MULTISPECIES: hypothetical protein [Cyanophyceae]|uniref:hypothetical protein n=1 Tax=Cyanophyceae TaxID=3028117 RepID=UPI001685A0A3|nr:hypothetical protein [Trichocoleus sp. FACHB-69]MBD1934863.1 hypothetical protein [Trichocoleus sp. FACHB-69]